MTKSAADYIHYLNLPQADQAMRRDALSHAVALVTSGVKLPGDFETADVVGIAEELFTFLCGKYVTPAK